ncbi:MAG: phosphonate C-P lyase system protein PhnH [Haloferacaceae archaeon]
MRALGVDPVHDTRETFRALCDAMSRPGTRQTVPATPADHAVLATLVDHEVTVHTDDDAVREAFASQGRLAEAAPETADVVHARGVPSWDVRECSRGSLTEPSDGATAVYRVDDLGDAPTPNLTAVTVTGPGVDGERRFGVSLPATELAAVAAAQSAYPRGVDAVFATETTVAALPRSVELEVA